MARTAATNIQRPARMVIESFSDSSARASRISFCIRSARSVMTLENAVGSDEYASAMAVARVVVLRRLDRRGGYRASVFKRSESEKSGGCGQAEHQSWLTSREVGGALGQLLDGLTLQTFGIIVDVVRKSPDKTGEHRAFVSQIIGCKP